MVVKNSGITKSQLVDNINGKNIRIKQKKQQEKQITIMLMSLSFTFICLTLPYSVYELLRKVGYIDDILSRRYVYILLIFKSVSFLN